MSDYIKGKSYYAPDGREVEYVCEASGGYMVSYIVEAEDEEPYFSEPHFERRLFSKPPQERVSQAILELEQKQREKFAELTELETSIRKAKKEYEDLIKKLSTRVPALRRIEDFIDNKITHFIVKKYSGLELVDINYLKCSEDRYSKDLKLISLFGKSDGNLLWGVNQYRDGSGLNTTIYPFCSLEEAMAEGAKMMEEKFTEWAKEKKGLRVEGLMTEYKNMKLEAPEELFVAAKQYLVDKAQEAVIKAEKELEEKRLLLKKYDRPNFAHA